MTAVRGWVRLRLKPGTTGFVHKEQDPMLAGQYGQNAALLTCHT